MAQLNTNPTPTQPDPPAQSGPPLIPVASISLPAGVKIPFPGKRGVHNGFKEAPAKMRPGTGEFWQIFEDTKGHLLVSHFPPGPDLKRPPADTMVMPQAMATWRRA